MPARSISSSTLAAAFEIAEQHLLGDLQRQPLGREAAAATTSAGIRAANPLAARSAGVTLSDRRRPSGQALAAASARSAMWRERCATWSARSAMANSVAGADQRRRRDGASAPAPRPRPARRRPARIAAGRRSRSRRGRARRASRPRARPCGCRAGRGTRSAHSTRAPGRSCAVRASRRAGRARGPRVSPGSTRTSAMRGHRRTVPAPSSAAIGRGDRLAERLAEPLPALAAERLARDQRELAPADARREPFAARQLVGRRSGACAARLRPARRRPRPRRTPG